MKKTLLIIGLFLSIFISSPAQVNYKISDSSTMSISGTSTIHDWTSTVNEISGTYVFKENVQNKKIPKSGSIIHNLKMVVPVESIESTRGATMDNKTYNALKSEEHPDIIFQVREDKILGINTTNPGMFQLEVTGTLTLAGHTKNVTLTLDGQRVDTNTYTFKGSYPVDMVAYEINPPTAMFGQIKTGKDVTIDFELTLIRE